jgi:hypothetical protein
VPSEQRGAHTTSSAAAKYNRHGQNREPIYNNTWNDTGTSDAIHLLNLPTKYTRARIRRSPDQPKVALCLEHTTDASSSVCHPPLVTSCMPCLLSSCPLLRTAARVAPIMVARLAAAPFHPPTDRPPAPVARQPRSTLAAPKCLAASLRSAAKRREFRGPASQAPLLCPLST